MVAYRHIKGGQLVPKEKRGPRASCPRGGGHPVLGLHVISPKFKVHSNSAHVRVQKQEFQNMSEPCVWRSQQLRSSSCQGATQATGGLATPGVQLAHGCSKATVSCMINSQHVRA